MKTARVLFVSIAIALALKTAHGTTVIPPTFNQLVEQAQLIFEGSVIDVRSRWTGEGVERRIVSDVTFQIEDTMKGAPGAIYTSTMLGGTIGEETLQVADAPRFKRGDHDILFVENNGAQFIPLVGITHGRYRVQRDEITTDDGIPLMQNGTALHAAEFKGVIRAQLTAAGR